MKKMLITLGLTAAIAAGAMSVSAQSLWKYNETISIDMQETSIKKTTNGHEILNFVAIEAIDGGTCTYTYAYDRTAGTIQIVEMERKPRSSTTRATSLPPPSTLRTRSFANALRWPKLCTRKK